MSLIVCDYAYGHSVVLPISRSVIYLKHGDSLPFLKPPKCLQDVEYIKPVNIDNRRHRFVGHFRGNVKSCGLEALSFARDTLFFYVTGSHYWPSAYDGACFCTSQIDQMFPRACLNIFDCVDCGRWFSKGKSIVS